MLLKSQLLARAVSKPNRILCDHLFGENHSHKHHMIVGVFVMSTSVYMAKTHFGIHMEIAHYICDGVGYFFHGVGAAPFVEGMIAFGAARSSKSD